MYASKDGFKTLKVCRSGVEGAAKVRVRGGAADVEGASAGLALALLAPLIVTVRSAGFQQFFLI